MESEIPGALLARYPAQKRTLERLDMAEKELDDLERRIELRRAVVGVPGVAAATRSNGILRLWVDHARTSVGPGVLATTGLGPVPRAGAPAAGAPPSSSKKRKHRDEESEGYWELHVEGALVDDGAAKGCFDVTSHL